MPPTQKPLQAWRSMIGRCHNPNDRRYPSFGQKGIQVSPLWRDNYPQFLKDVGPAPSPLHWLVRLDSSQNYAPGNMAWLTPQYAALLKKRTRFIPLNGRKSPLILLAKEAGKPQVTTLEMVRRVSTHSATIEALQLTCQGETLPLSEWANRTRLPLLWDRLRRGWSPEQMLGLPAGAASSSSCWPTTPTPS